MRVRRRRNALAALVGLDDPTEIDAFLGELSDTLRVTWAICRDAFHIDGVDASSRRHCNVPRWWCDQPPEEEASMEQVDIIGIDLAKRSFQLHGARADGSVAFADPR